MLRKTKAPPRRYRAGQFATPEMPKNVVISEDGAGISGTAEPGSAITIATPDGKPLGSGKRMAVIYPSRPAQTNGEQVTVTARNSANNVSPQLTAQARYHRPDKPIITPGAGRC